MQAYSTPTGSMKNTILIGDKMFFNKYLYGGTTPRKVPFTNIKLPYFQLPAVREPKRGDIVSFETPGYRDEVVPFNPVELLKRLIGEPGDVIQVIDKVLYVNDKVFENPIDAQFITPRPDKTPDPQVFPKGSNWNQDNYGPLIVPKQGDVVTLDKNSYQKWDTFIKREGHKIEMKSDGIFVDGIETNQYIVERNYYFMMGDNRNNSLDSRFWGFVPWKT